MPSHDAPDAIREAKRALRRDVLARLRSMTPEQRRREGAALHARLFALEAFGRARAVHCFLSLPEEVDTAPVLTRCAAEGKAVFVPYQLPAAGRLGWARWSAHLPLAAGALGIREPAPEARMDAQDAQAALATIDLVIVPGVAFDRAGGRLGHGKGYYDRFLAEWAAARGGLSSAQPGLCVALVFSAQIVPRIPTTLTDIRMDLILTPSETVLISAS